MKITILSFGPARVCTGCGEFQMEVPEGALASEVLERLFQSYPKLRGLTHGLRIAVNEEYAALTTRLMEGQTLALIPPVQGG